MNGSGGSAVVVASRGGNDIMRMLLVIVIIFVKNKKMNDSCTDYSGRGKPQPYIPFGLLSSRLTSFARLMSRVSRQKCVMAKPSHRLAVRVKSKQACFFMEGHET